MKKIIALLIAVCMSLSFCSCGATWQEKYDLGMKYLSDGNYKEAAIAFEAAVKIDPKKYEGYYQLGISYRSDGQTDKAVGALTTAVSLAPEVSADAKHELGVAYIDGGRYSDAEALLKPLYEKGDEDAGVLLLAVYGQQGNTDELTKLLTDAKLKEKIAEHAPKDGVLYFGAYDENGKKKGTGIGFYPGGYIYIGEYADDVRSGQGTWSNGDGWYFTGQWANDAPNGQGEYHVPANSWTRSGNFTDGLENGSMTAAGGSEKYNEYQYTVSNGKAAVIGSRPNHETGGTDDYVAKDGDSILKDNGGLWGVKPWCG